MTFNHRIIMRVTSVIILFEGIAMLVPMFASVYYEETACSTAFFFVGICCIAAGLTAYKLLKYNTLYITGRDGYFVTLLSWVMVCIIGALPYFFSGQGYTIIESLFESVAGWTTTGAHTVSIYQMPKSLILWKSINNWLGGMGILVLTVSIFPILGVGGQKMAEAEMPGPTLKKLYARIGDTAKTSYKLYIILTILELCLLLPSGLNPFDALVNTFSSISTAGILNIGGTFNASITTYVKVILIIFSLIGSINFIIYFFVSVRRFKDIYKNVELRTYLALLMSATIIMAIILVWNGNYENIFAALRDSATQAVSYGSTSGFTIANIGVWPTSCKLILIALVFIGGCSFSTSGGIKIIRFIVFFKIVMRGVYKRIHPKAVKPIMIEKSPVSAGNASSITVFVLLFFSIYVVASIAMAIDNHDLETTLSASIAAFSNNGTGFGLMTDGDFGIFSWWGKLCACLLMLSGRLEMYAILMLFSRSFWNTDRARS